MTRKDLRIVLSSHFQWVLTINDKHHIVYRYDTPFVGPAAGAGYPAPPDRPQPALRGADLRVAVGQLSGRSMDLARARGRRRCRPPARRRRNARDPGDRDPR